MASFFIFVDAIYKESFKKKIDRKRKRINSTCGLGGYTCIYVSHKHCCYIINIILKETSRITMSVVDEEIAYQDIGNNSKRIINEQPYIFVICCEIDHFQIWLRMELTRLVLF